MAMKNMTLNAIAAACNGKLFNGCQSGCKEAAGVVIDSRKVEKDFLFIATVGERVDGHSFIDDVFIKGAMGVVCQKVPADPKCPYILVEDSLAALKNIAKWYRMQLGIKVVGITGSVGKTSTKEFVASVLAQKYSVIKTEGNFNNEVGLPLTVLQMREHHEVAVLEMGISDFGEMHRLSEIAKPDFCLLTNIGQCHLENLKSRQGILKAKTEIFDFMSNNGRVCVCGDDDMLATIGEINGHKPIKYGFDHSNDLYATNIKHNGLFGSSCDIHYNNDVFTVEIPLPGEYMVTNALAAASVGLLLGLTYDKIAAGIKAVRPVGGRSNIIQHGKNTIIDDCYNANPVSMKAAIDLLGMAKTRKVAILGDMYELGENEKALHKEIGAYAVAANVDVLVCTGKLSAEMYNGACEAIKVNPEVSCDLLYFQTRDELITALSEIIKVDDTVLVKASNAMGFKVVVSELLK